METTSNSLAEDGIESRVQENQKWILELVDGRELLNVMTPVISFEQINQIRGENGKRKATEEVLRILQESEAKDKWNHLIKALEENDYPYMVSILKGKANVESEKMKRERKVIGCCLKKIETIDPVELSRFLFESDTIAPIDIEQIQQAYYNKGRTHGVWKLLELVPNRTQTWYDDFKNALNAIGYNSVSKEIDHNEEQKK